MRGRYWWYIAGGIALLIAVSASFEKRLLNVLSNFIPSVEGFRSNPYWDAGRYSWGYGTMAPGPAGTITRSQAFADMVAYLLNDYTLLKPRITRDLSVRQWAALLSFAYNTGVGAAYKLVAEINSYDDAALFVHMRQYKYSDGLVNSTLVERREKEISLWNT
jgi:lysozyme